MYHLSGTRDSVEVLIKDWKSLVVSMKITSQGNQQTYLYHKGKPLMVLWGLGFNDKRHYKLISVERMIDFLQHDFQYGGCSIMLGVPAYWRERIRDTENDPRLHEVLHKVDIIHPWAVGRFKTEEAYQTYSLVQQADMAWCQANKMDYVPVVFPGFSWHNMNPAFPADQIPRNRVQF